MNDVIQMEKFQSIYNAPYEELSLAFFKSPSAAHVVPQIPTNK